MAETYTKLFNTIITSSIWSEDNDTRILWITMLAMADYNGVVLGSIRGLADMARLDVQICIKSLQKLMSPDPYSRSKERQGRRVEEIEGGWLIINHQLYRDKKANRAEYFREWRAQQSANDLKQSASHKDKDKDIYNTFVQFWNAYPKHKAKKVAFRSWQKLDFSNGLFETIMTALEAQKKQNDWRKDSGQFIPLASTWLNQARWEDEIETVRVKDLAKRCPLCGRYLDSSGSCYCGYKKQ